LADKKIYKSVKDQCLLDEATKKTYEKGKITMLYTPAEYIRLLEIKKGKLSEELNE